MKKNLWVNSFFHPSGIRKILLFMKMSTLFIFLGFMQVSAKVYSQNNAISLNMDHVELSRALRVIEKKSDYRFLYNDALLSPDMTVNIHAQDALVPTIVNHILAKTPLTFKIIGKHLIVIAAKNSRIEAIAVKGHVANTNGEALIGVTIQVKGTTLGTTTDASGGFALDVPDSAVLVISSIGYQTKEVGVNGQTQLNITLQPSSSGLNELVVIGYGTQKKSQVTGAISSVQASQLQDMPVMRVEQSLQNIQAMIPRLEVRAMA